MVTELGRVPHSTALGLIHSADALFLPVASGKRLRVHLPGKLYEYAVSGRPILAVADTPSEVSMFLHDVGGGIVIPPDDSEALARALAALCSNALRVPPLRQPQLDKYERGALTQKLADLLNRVSDAAA
jgi:glycosyltransferase involved in cell wall biosynthesis